MVHTLKRFVVVSCLCVGLSSFSTACGFVSGTHGLILITEYGANESYEKTINAHPYEKNHPVGLGATAKMFLTALYQEAAPILVPAPLLQVVLDHVRIARNLLGSSADYFYQTYCTSKRFRDCSEAQRLHAYGTYLNTLYQAVDTQAHMHVSAAAHEQTLWDNPLFDASSAPSSFDETSATWHEAIAYLMCYYAPWDRYEVRMVRHNNYYFYLCIPKRLLDSSVSGRLTLKHALRYEQCPMISDIAHYTPPVAVARDAATLHYEYDESLYYSLQQLLVAKSGSSDDPVWTLYCMGHGSFCYDACDKMREQLQIRTQCLNDKARFSAEAQRWDNESAVWQQKQHTDRVYDSHHHTYIVYDQQAVRHNVDACQHNVQTCKYNQTICDQNCATIEHNIQCIACSNTIAGISQIWFKKIMHLFDTQVKTNLLFYRSCSAGGQQLVDLFTDENNQPLRLSYAVIVGTLCEAASSTFSPLFHVTWFRQKAKNLFIRIPIEKLIDKHRHTVALDSHYNLTTFFSQAQRPSSTFDFQLFIESVNPVVRSAVKTTVDDNASWFSVMRAGVDSVVKAVLGDRETVQDIEREDIANIPSIRFPYETEFHVIDLHNTMLPLTTKQCAADASSSYAIRAPYEIVLLYAPTINKPLQITLREHGLFPAFVSMIPGAAYHVIEKLDAPGYAFSTMFTSFFACPELKAPKWFYCKSIDGVNDIVNAAPLGFTQTLTNVYIFNYIAWNKSGSSASDNLMNGIMFDCQSRTYLMTWPFDKPMPPCSNLQTISGYQQKNIADLIVKQCSPKNHESYCESVLPIMTIRDIERKCKLA